MSLKPFFQKAAEEAEKQERLARMTRQQAFNEGLLTVEDLDDEELRAGKCRDPDGKLRLNPNKTEPIPRDIYDEAIAEHERRFNQRLRERLDKMIDVMVEVAEDETVEPRDRLEAAKYIFERVAGKTPERVNVQVSKAPWEEMMQGIAKLTREQSHQLRQGVIDAEVVDIPDSQDVPDNVSPVHEESDSGDQIPNGRPGEAGSQPQHESAGAIPGEYEDEQVDQGADSEEVRQPGEPIRTSPVTEYTQAYCEAVSKGEQYRQVYAPTWDYPENSSSTVANKGTELLDATRRQSEIAAARKAKRKAIQEAKKKRKIARATGQDVVLKATGGKDISMNEQEQDGDPDNVRITFDTQS